MDFALPPLSLARHGGGALENAAAKFALATHLLEMLNTPGAKKVFIGTFEHHTRHFARLKAVYATLPARRDESPFEGLTHAQRGALKRALHEDVMALARAAEEEAAAAKFFDGAPLPTDPIECAQCLAGRIDALERELVALRRAQFSVLRIARNVAAIAALPDFTAEAVLEI